MPKPMHFSYYRIVDIPVTPEHGFCTKSVAIILLVEQKGFDLKMRIIIHCYANVWKVTWKWVTIGDELSGVAESATEEALSPFIWMAEAK